MHGHENAPTSEKRWHIDKTINLAHMLTTMGLIAALFAWGGDVDKRIALLEDNRVVQKAIDMQQDEQAREAVLLLREELRDVGHKLDRLSENLQRVPKQ